MLRPTVLEFGRVELAAAVGIVEGEDLAQRRFAVAHQRILEGPQQILVDGQLAVEISGVALKPELKVLLLVPFPQALGLHL